MSRRPCSKPGHVGRYFDGRCETCQAEGKQRYRRRQKRARAQGFTREQYDAQQEILDGLGKSDGKPSPAKVYSIALQDWDNGDVFIFDGITARQSITRELPEAE